ncbi:hypothetical protein J2848_000359 [Azospirillum lipoferum]|uniref:Holin n=1 Tax=Azospirillum lipoferum TaxID=193 RepID=A0A5A9GTV5_AZOLI|nr:MULTISPECIES: hypothetical protein [Azospirillum]KAA0597212.1 hypothetical protein FZ942_08965 [Azospirillum lipoferum]MCP1608723.1 hypothetical protein [Azospirillum lipoferum]MDW5535959.1 hypothetical protein [Azospirillum sp. NL1]
MEKLKGDALIAGLVSSPAWVAALQNVNVLLTTVTLLLGIALGIRRMRSDDKDGDDARGD